MNSVSRHTLSVSDSVYKERAQSFLGVGSVQPPPRLSFFSNLAHDIDWILLQYNF